MDDPAVDRGQPWDRLWTSVASPGDIRGIVWGWSWDRLGTGPRGSSGTAREAVSEHPRTGPATAPGPAPQPPPQHPRNTPAHPTSGIPRTTRSHRKLLLTGVEQRAKVRSDSKASDRVRFRKCRRIDPRAVAPPACSPTFVRAHVRKGGGFPPPVSGHASRTVSLRLPGDPFGRVFRLGTREGPCASCRWRTRRAGAGRPR